MCLRKTTMRFTKIYSDEPDRLKKERGDSLLVCKVSPLFCS